MSIVHRVLYMDFSPGAMVWMMVVSILLFVAVLDAKRQDRLKAELTKPVDAAYVQRMVQERAAKREVGREGG